MTFTPTMVRLISNVPFFNTYDHTIDFKDSTEQRLYFESKASHTYTDFTYQREEQSIKVPGLYDELYNCNYLMYHNPDSINKWFYAFITKKEFINLHTTRIYFEIDVYQTWQFVMKWKPSFIAREHRLRFFTDGSPVVNTVDEGLNYGDEYEIVDCQHVQAYENIYYLVIISKGLLHGADAKKPKSVLNGVPTPLSFYLHPFYLSGTVVDATVGGTAAGLSSITDLLTNMCTQDDAVKNIVSMFITEYPGYNATLSGSTLTFDGTTFDAVEIADNVHPNMKTIYVKEIPTYNGLIKDMGNKYDGFETVSEGKLLMYPYCVTIMDDFKGNRTEIKNEYIKDPNLLIGIKGSMGVSNKTSYQVENYLQDTANTMYAAQTVLEHAVINMSPNDIPVLTEYLAAFLQGNRNQLEQTKTAAVQSAIFSTVAGGGAANGAMMGSMVGGAPGMFIGAAAGAVHDAASNTFNAYQTIQGLNAKLRDIQATPPELAKMGNNTAFDYGNGIHGVYIMKKQITLEYRKKLTDHFKMYGYKINELKLPNLKTRESWNYVQTVGANITGNIPNDDLFRLKAIFNNGITIWHGDYVGSYDRSNDEL